MATSARDRLTMGQLRKLRQLMQEKGVTIQNVQTLLASGLLADVFDLFDVRQQLGSSRIHRDDVRCALGLYPKGLRVSIPITPLETLLAGVFRNVRGIRREDFAEHFAFVDSNPHKKQELCFHFLHFGFRPLSQRDILKECELRRVVPANVRHLLAVCKQEPRILNSFLVMAPGSVVDGRIPYAELTWPEYHERTFGIGPLPKQYPLGFRFLVYENT